MVKNPKQPDLRLFRLYVEAPGFQGYCAEVVCKDKKAAMDLFRKEYGRTPPERDIHDCSVSVGGKSLMGEWWVRNLEVGKVYRNQQAEVWLRRTAMSRRNARRI